MILEAASIETASEAITAETITTEAPITAESITIEAAITAETTTIEAEIENTTGAENIEEAIAQEEIEGRFMDRKKIINILFFIDKIPQFTLFVHIYKLKRFKKSRKTYQFFMIIVNRKHDF